MFGKKRTIDIQFARSMSPGELEKLQKRSSGEPHLVNLSQYCETLDATYVLMGKIKRIGKKLRKYHTFTDCVIHIEKENLQKCHVNGKVRCYSTAYRAVFYRDHQKARFRDERI